MSFWPRFAISRTDLGNWLKAEDIFASRPAPGTEFEFAVIVKLAERPYLQSFARMYYGEFHPQTHILQDGTEIGVGWGWSWGWGWAVELGTQGQGISIISMISHEFLLASVIFC